MRDLRNEFIRAVEADNWALVNILRDQEKLTIAETIEHLFTATAFLYAELREPKRAPVFAACLEIMRALNDPRHAEAVQHRFDLLK